MRNYVYFWIEFYRLMDSTCQKPLYLFEDYAMNLSSKYRISHKWTPKKHEFSFESCFRNEYMISNLKENFYSENFIDLKILLGNNGTGKTTMIELLSDVISGKNFHNDCTYILAWEENGKFKYYLNKGVIWDKVKGKIVEIKDEIVVQSKIPFSCCRRFTFDTVVLYSQTFPNYWPNLDIEGEYQNCYDIRTKTLLKENVERANNGLRKGSIRDNLICYSKVEENKIIDLVLDFSAFLENIISLPSVLFFVISEENIKNGIQEIADTIQTKENNAENIVKVWGDFYDSLTEFDDQIKFACIVNAFRDKVYSLDSRKKIDLSAFTIEKVRNLDDFLKNISSYLGNKKNIQLYDKVKKLIQYLSPFRHKSWFLLNIYSYRIQISLYKKEIREIRKILDELEGVTRIFNLEWGRPLSSGESAYLMFFGRLYSCLKNYKVNMESFYKRNGNEFHGCLFLDEIDLYLHPEWQRMWFDKFIEGLSLIRDELKMPLKIQLFMATHSPFMVTDFSSESILTLQREKFENGEWGATSVKTNVLQKTMASNIYDVLDSGFILDGTLGWFIERKIKELLKRIEEKRITANDQEFIKQIGDPIIQSIISNRMRP